MHKALKTLNTKVFVVGLLSSSLVAFSALNAAADGMDREISDSKAAAAKASAASTPASAAAASPIPGVDVSHQIALERAQGPQLAKAMGHYSRARSLLIAAIQEFDQGYGSANPEAILDARQWRSDVVDRAQELERLLDPQPRIGSSGVRFNADSRLINEKKK